MPSVAPDIRRRDDRPPLVEFGFLAQYRDHADESRDDRDINQHFLRPAAKKLGIYRPGFGFHQFRREALTVYGADPMQARKIAGHSHVDMTGAYTLDDRERQGTAIRAHQERIMGVVPIRQKVASNRPKRAKKAGNAS